MRVGYPTQNNISKITWDADFVPDTDDSWDIGSATKGIKELHFPDHVLRQQDSLWVYLQKSDLSARTNLSLFTLHLLGDIDFGTSGRSLKSPNSDNGYVLIQTRENAVGQVEVARIKGGVNPSFDIKYLTLAAAAGVAEQFLQSKGAGVSPAWGDASKVSKLTVNYDDASPVTVLAAPAGAMIIGVKVNITTPFAGTSPTLDIGDAGDADCLQTSAIIAPTAAGWKADGARLWGVGVYLSRTLAAGAGDINIPHLYTTATNILATIGGTSLTAGVADIYIVYA